VSRPTHGLRDWLWQRFSAVYLGAYLLYVVMHFIRHPQPDYRQWHDWLGHPLMSIASATFIIAILVHAWVGMRDVVLDYAHALHLRLLILSLIALTLVACGLWALQVLLVVAAGS
jgi:succinate dehydrogenase / fumarate reductase membrane anchor subunit